MKSVSCNLINLALRYDLLGSNSGLIAHTSTNKNEANLKILATILMVEACQTRDRNLVATVLLALTMDCGEAVAQEFVDRDIDRYFNDCDRLWLTTLPQKSVGQNGNHKNYFTLGVDSNLVVLLSS